MFPRTVDDLRARCGLRAIVTVTDEERRLVEYPDLDGRHVVQ
jgi:hypothetical protein